MSANVYVYRLEVEIPDDVNWLHPPQAWIEFIQDCGAAAGPDASQPFFSWPARRNFLSRAAAERMAKRLRSYGASVQIVRSEPVMFPQQPQEAAIAS